MRTSTSTLRNRQTGAALGIALLILLIITILGVAAVRATQVELKLSQNAESRMAATQAAQSMVAFVSTADNMPVNDNIGYHACVRAGSVSLGIVPVCASSTTAIALTGITAPLLAHGYAEVRREQPLFVEVNVLRAVGSELSAKNYDFARFTATGGYDRSSEGMSAAEITEGILRLHTKVVGVNYEN